MNVTVVSGECLIIDADVLIDLVMADRNVLSKIVQYLAPVNVVSSVLRQVREIESREQIIGLGITVVEPAIEDLHRAAVISNPSKYVDYVCLLTAKRHGFICVTNDAELLNLCKDEGVRCLREFRLLLYLHKSGGISVHDAIKLAQQIHRNNPRFITEAIVNDFIKELKLVGDSHGHQSGITF